MTASPASRPAAATSQGRGGPRRSAKSTAKAANPRAVEIACEKNSAANTIRIVQRPNVIAAAVP